MLTRGQFIPLHRLLTISESELSKGGADTNIAASSSASFSPALSSSSSSQDISHITRLRPTQDQEKKTAVVRNPNSQVEFSRKRKMRNGEGWEEDVEVPSNMSHREENRSSFNDSLRASKKVCRKPEREYNHIEMGSLEYKQANSEIRKQPKPKLLDSEKSNHRRSQEEQDHLDSALILGSLNQQLPHVHCKSLVYSPFFQCVTNIQFYMNICKSLSSSCQELDKPFREKDRICVWNYFHWITGFSSLFLCFSN